MSAPKLALWWDWRGICEEQVLELRRAGKLATDVAVPTDLDGLLRIEVAGVEVDVEGFLYVIERRLQRASYDMAEAEVRRILGLALKYRDPEHYLEILVGLYDRLGEPTAKKGMAPVVKLPPRPKDAG